MLLFLLLPSTLLAVLAALWKALLLVLFMLLLPLLLLIMELLRPRNFLVLAGAACAERSEAHF